MGKTVNRLDQIVDHFKALGYRMTPQRAAILETLTASDDHPSAEMIFERIKKDFPYTSFATVYKTIAVVKEIGEALELEFSNDANRYDGNKPYPHPHLICTRCGKIMDSESDLFRRLQDKISKETGFEITHHRLDFYGICPDCH